MVLRNFIYSLFFLASSINVLCQNDSIINVLEGQINAKPIKSLKKIERLFSSTDTISLNNARLYDLKGEILKNNQIIYNAIEAFEKSYKIYKKLNNKEKQIILLNKISSLYIVLNRFSKVIDQQNKISDLLENNADKNLYSSRYTANMALMYFKTDSIKKAKYYLYKSIETAKNHTNLSLLNTHYIDLSRIYIETKQLDSALYFSNKSLKYGEKSKNYQLTIRSLINKGEIFEKKTEYTKAEREFEKAIRISNIAGFNNAHIYAKLGNFYKRVYLYEFANKNLRKAIKKTIKTENNDEIRNLYHDLMENSILQNKPDRALYYLKKHDFYSAINEKEKVKRNTDYINDRYNMQQEEIIYLNNKHKLTEKESELVAQKKVAKSSRVLYTTLLFVFGLLLFLGYLYYRYYKLKNEKLNMQLKNTVLRLQMNPHFIFNSLTAIQNTILKNDTLKSAELIAIFSKLIRQNLDYSNRKSILLSEEVDMLTNYLMTQKFRFDNTFSFKINVSEEIETDEVNIPPMLIQPFVENAIEHGLKHNNKKGKININITKTKNGIHITVTDNGIGFKSSKKYTAINDSLDKIHAINIFKERLRIRNKKEENSFKITDITNKKNKVIGTKVEFSLKNR